MFCLPARGVLLLSGIPSFPEDATDGVLEGCLLLCPWLSPGLALLRIVSGGVVKSILVLLRSRAQIRGGYPHTTEINRKYDAFSVSDSYPAHANQVG